MTDKNDTVNAFSEKLAMLLMRQIFYAVCSTQLSTVSNTEFGNVLGFIVKIVEASLLQEKSEHRLHSFLLKRRHQFAPVTLTAHKIKAILSK